ncbi:MAG: hypothetical protein GY708_11540 [Actinomycetia bacterium]|nr:hypothetical protein [Actinomycetes bacterium]MCP4959368.1 hypothetical protein [Actinomycetes bacterium]
MGQSVRVVEKKSEVFPGTVRYETDRPLSGTGHKTYTNAEGAINDLDPADVLARRLFERGGIEHVHVNGNIITIRYERGSDSDGVVELVENLFLHYT